MIVRVPLLLQRSVAVIHRLSIGATRDHMPPGDVVEGYDPTFQEPIVYTEGAERVSSRTELAPVRIPCQVEMMTEERLRQYVGGADPVTNMVLVFHRYDLDNLGLLDGNREVVLKKGDRIEELERYGGAPGNTIKRFTDPGLFIWEVRSASWGFGPDGYDLELAFTSKRREGVAATKPK
jgi:hypothetical protein